MELAVVDALPVAFALVVLDEPRAALSSVCRSESLVLLDESLEEPNSKEFELPLKLTLSDEEAEPPPNSEVMSLDST